MLTKYGKFCLKGINGAGPNGSTGAGSNFAFKNTSGVEKRVGKAWGTSVTPSNADARGFLKPGTVIISSSGAGFVLGSGSTPPTEDDYNLEQQIISGVTASVAAGEVIENENDYGYSVSSLITITNPSQDPVTVAEIGITKPSRYWTSPTSTNGNGSFLIDRTLLDEPITIPPSGSATIEYTIEVQ